MASGPPKLKPFTKTKVVLAIEQQIDQSNDLTAFAPKPFRDPEGRTIKDAVRGQEPETESEGPTMFKTKKSKAVLMERAPALKKEKAKKPYERVNLISRQEQVAEVEKLPAELKDEATKILEVETMDPYKISPEVFAPITRSGFGSYLYTQYRPIFPKASERALNVATCATQGDQGVKEVKIYHYQAFIREYLQYESPYRGLLVYHGLGSGKTCSAIAAAEALFGTHGMKIVVMTPLSLRNNFISEIGFCGFKHFRLQNYWTPLSLKPGSVPEAAMVKLFARNVYGIPESYFTPRGRGKIELEQIWVPDFQKKPNFDSLTPQQREEIQAQLKATIENRITFINYNSISKAELKTMICSKPDIFDNAVIVVDEIHNLTRLIQGSLELYLSPRRGRSKNEQLKARETLTPERTTLPRCGKNEDYMRGYLFYRLFMDAKNAKVVGLSGTPLINFPEELGILMNILHGPIHTIEFNVELEGSRELRPILEAIIARNENLDTAFFKTSDRFMTVTITRLPEQFTKVFSEDSSTLGIKRRDPTKVAPTLEEIWLDLKESLKAQDIRINGNGIRAAKELLPSWDIPFRGAFLEEDGLTLKNEIVLKKRIRGLISYYKGIQGDVMPKVIKDEVVAIPLTGYALKLYNKMRNQEIQIEMSSSKGTGPVDIWAEISEIANMKSSSNYRMSSRQACNFVFPEGIQRPTPRNLEEQGVETGNDRDQIVDADIEGAAPGRDEAAAEAEAEQELSDKILKEETMGEVPPGTGDAAKIMSKAEMKRAYQMAIRTCKDKLRSMGATHLQLDGPAEHNLAKYSPKFHAMLTTINRLEGSSLVYSAFLDMEGIGILGICMEANGYVPIEVIEYGNAQFKFSERTTTSLMKGPKVPEKRYIEFTGVGSKELRSQAVNIFNARLDKVAPEIQKVLKEGGWTNNLDGGLCRVFCITSAGAEGLSLKTVRGVHIMEPYWNTVRTQQVKGRAVRICSHMELPPEQQTVEIYTYCTVIPEEAILAQAVDVTLERSDSFSANEAIAIGVPVAAQIGDITSDMFFKVDQISNNNNKQEGITSDTTGPVKFAWKLVNSEYRGFSNQAPAPVIMDGKRYPTLEHYIQSMKFPSDSYLQETIRVAQLKDLSKLVKDNDAKKDPNWNTVREGFMLNALRAKFQQNAGLLEQLKSTGRRPLVEASSDVFWGEGASGKGKNRIGRLLEQVREELREYSPTEVPTEVPTDLPAPLVPEVLESEYQEGGEIDDQEGGDPEDRKIILTSDQKVLLISLRKERVLGSLQNLMKSVAVDCRLNKEDNKSDAITCFELPGLIKDYAYHPDLESDILESKGKFRIKQQV